VAAEVEVEVAEVVVAVEVEVEVAEVAVEAAEAAALETLLHEVSLYATCALYIPMVSAHSHPKRHQGAPAIADSRQQVRQELLCSSVYRGYIV
jgi:hypothetical protein